MTASTEVEDPWVDLFPVEQDSAEPKPRLWNANDLADAKQPEWLARNRIPRSAVSILVGDEGIGKSLWWVWVAAAVTTGHALPEFGIPARDPERVLLILTEDEWSFTVKPRLLVAGADLDFVQVICEEEDGSGSPVFPRDMGLVRDSHAAMVVVDAFLDTVAGGITMKDPQQARKALHPWKEAATSTGASIILLTHTNRVDSKNARDKYGITGELRKKARMTLYAQEDDQGRLVIGPEKSNITAKLPASMFRIDPVQMFKPSEDHDGTVPKLVFIGESDKTAREHLEANYEAAHADEDGGDQTEAEAWLEDFLTQNGSAPSMDVKTAGRKNGLSERTLKRAASKLNVTYEQKGFPRKTWWSLPSGASQATGTPHVSECGPTGPTGPTVDDKGIQDGPTGDMESTDGPTERQSGQLGQLGQPQRDGLTGVPTVARQQPTGYTAAIATELDRF